MKSKWKNVGVDVDMTHHECIHGRQCEIVLSRRPHYCDRGIWLAQIFPRGELARDLDSQDGWPRYYMDLDRAKLEIEDWMKKRGQWD